jgi:ferredoxin
MTYVINEPCIGVKDVSCTEVCPVDCIHPTPDEPGFAEAEQLHIDPEECIDCDACVEACPVDAITSEGPGASRMGAVHREERRVLPKRALSERWTPPARHGGGPEGWWMLGATFVVPVAVGLVGGDRRRSRDRRTSSAIGELGRPHASRRCLEGRPATR